MKKASLIFLAGASVLFYSCKYNYAVVMPTNGKDSIVAVIEANEMPKIGDKVELVECPVQIHGADYLCANKNYKAEDLFTTEYFHNESVSGTVVRKYCVWR